MDRCVHASQWVKTPRCFLETTIFPQFSAAQVGYLDVVPSQQPTTGSIPIQPQPRTLRTAKSKSERNSAAPAISSALRCLSQFKPPRLNPFPRDTARALQVSRGLAI